MKKVHSTLLVFVLLLICKFVHSTEMQVVIDLEGTFVKRIPKGLVAQYGASDVYQDEANAYVVYPEARRVLEKMIADPEIKVTLLNTDPAVNRAELDLFLQSFQLSGAPLKDQIDRSISLEELPRGPIDHASLTRDPSKLLIISDANDQIAPTSEALTLRAGPFYYAFNDYAHAQQVRASFGTEVSNHEAYLPKSADDFNLSQNRWSAIHHIVGKVKLGLDMGQDIATILSQHKDMKDNIQNNNFSAPFSAQPEKRWIVSGSKASGCQVIDKNTGREIKKLKLSDCYSLGVIKKFNRSGECQLLNSNDKFIVKLKKEDCLSSKQKTFLTQFKQLNSQCLKVYKCLEGSLDSPKGLASSLRDIVSHLSTSGKSNLVSVGQNLDQFVQSDLPRISKLVQNISNEPSPSYDLARVIHQLDQLESHCMIEEMKSKHGDRIGQDQVGLNSLNRTLSTSDKDKVNDHYQKCVSEATAKAEMMTFFNKGGCFAYALNSVSRPLRAITDQQLKKDYLKDLDPASNKALNHTVSQCDLRGHSANLNSFYKRFDLNIQLSDYPDLINQCHDKLKSMIESFPTPAYQAKRVSDAYNPKVPKSARIDTSEAQKLIASCKENAQCLQQELASKVKSHLSPILLSSSLITTKFTGHESDPQKDQVVSQYIDDQIIPCLFRQQKSLSQCQSNTKALFESQVNSISFRAVPFKDQCGGKLIHAATGATSDIIGHMNSFSRANVQRMWAPLKASLTSDEKTIADFIRRHPPKMIHRTNVGKLRTILNGDTLYSIQEYERTQGGDIRNMTPTIEGTIFGGDDCVFVSIGPQDGIENYGNAYLELDQNKVTAWATMYTGLSYLNEIHGVSPSESGSVNNNHRKAYTEQIFTNNHYDEAFAYQVITNLRNGTSLRGKGDAAIGAYAGGATQILKDMAQLARDGKVHQFWEFIERFRIAYLEGKIPVKVMTQSLKGIYVPPGTASIIKAYPGVDPHESRIIQEFDEGDSI